MAKAENHPEQSMVTAPETEPLLTTSRFYQALAESAAPLSLIFEKTSGLSSDLVSAIALVAVLNGALVQIIMGSRVLYGLAAQGWLPGRFARTNARTRTPVFSTLVITAAVLALALGFEIEHLAGATTFITLTIFTLVNLSLLRIKRRDPRPVGIRVYPLWLPADKASWPAMFFRL